jgi:hypothetical protein
MRYLLVAHDVSPVLTVYLYSIKFAVKSGAFLRILDGPGRLAKGGCHEVLVRNAWV